ncbi:hypothetical protein ACWD26_23960 [Streptomyces sp. NPDC002787]
MSEGLRLRREFGRSELPLVRALVEEAALRARVTAAVRNAFLQAALEISTNAVLRGGGSAVAELRVREGELRCEVRDGGPGPASNGGAGPPARAAGRHGSRLAADRRRRPPPVPHLRPGHRGHAVRTSVGPGRRDGIGAPGPCYDDPARALNQAAT